jgi:hypothetical protein
LRRRWRVTLDSLLSTVERGFTAIADDIPDFKSKMATKDDIANLGGQLTSVQRDLKSILRHLDDLEEKFVDRKIAADVTTQLFRCLR